MKITTKVLGEGYCIVHRLPLQPDPTNKFQLRKGMPMDRKPLSDSAINEKVKGLNGWSHEGGKIKKTFTFNDFVGAFGFMSK